MELSMGEWSEKWEVYKREIHTIYGCLHENIIEQNGWWSNVHCHTHNWESRGTIAGWFSSKACLITSSYHVWRKDLYSTAFPRVDLMSCLNEANLNLSPSPFLGHSESQAILRIFFSGTTSCSTSIWFSQLNLDHNLQIQSGHLWLARGYSYYIVYSIL